MSVRLSADIGGTFTDVAAFDEVTGEMKLGKSLSTPQRLVEGIISAVDNARASFAEAVLFLHGSTIAINTMLERTGARTALLTTEGFRDIYEIGRINRPDSFNLYFKKHQPLVERALRFEVPERLKADGSVFKALNTDIVHNIADQLEREGIEAIAILFLHSYKNPAHEADVKRALSKRFPDVFITASHELSQEYREFERTSTVAANAYIGPRVKAYLKQIEEHLEKTGFNGKFFIVQSTGGLYGVEHAKEQCVRMMESGPAAGVIGTQALCAQLGLKDAISVDMGGTTAKAGVIRDGVALTSGGSMIGGYAQGLPLQIAMIDISEVGTGGGSIAYLSPGGAVRVGPRSAGAEPGPACYGRGGTEPTVTDANLVLGRLDPDHFLGGTMQLDSAAAQRAIRDKIAQPLGMDVVEAANGIVRIATASMAYAVRGVTTERGLDTGAFETLVAFGGAGPLHASSVARELRIRRILIPSAPGHFSAFGMLLSDLRHDFVRSLFVPLSDVSFGTLEKEYAALERAGVDAVKSTNMKVKEISMSRAMDMRYVGQEHAVTLQLPSSVFESQDRTEIKRQFDSLHELRYGQNSPNEKVEIVSLRTTVSGILPKPPLRPIPKGEREPDASARRKNRPVFMPKLGWVQKCPVYTRAGLLAGNQIAGPALVEEHASTTVVLPDDCLVVDDLGNLAITIG